MALFTDGTISNLEDLAAQDSSVLDVANTEGIDLTQKLALAHGELGVELASVLARSGGESGLANITVTAPLKLWHTFRTLELAYRDACYSQLNDRYRGRRDEYRDLARWAEEKLMQVGIGIVANPVSKAERPDVRTVAGALGAGTYFVSVSWAGAGGAEGASSDPVEVVVGAGSGIAVRAMDAPAVAAGWNVYVGATAESPRRQNVSLLGAGEEWLQSAAPSTSGPKPGSGQEPTYLRPRWRLIQRG